MNKEPNGRAPIERRVRPRPTCHFTPMTFEFADDSPSGQVSFWVCRHCGHTEEDSRDQQDA